MVIGVIIMVVDISSRRNFMMRWANMLDRCENPLNKSYHRYGGRGISVCNDWYNFFKYINDLPSGHFDRAELDRIDNDGNYEPSNVRWVSKQDNCKNRSNNRMITYLGITQCASDWARSLDINIATLAERLDNWSLCDALTLPKGHRLHNRWDGHVKSDERLSALAKPKKQLKLHEYEGKMYTMKELSVLSGVPVKLLRKRIDERKWNVSRAVESNIN
tara:strand:+ start:254 stop:907 length:654 start_codon:yes stop_codon:yes gene_type:complete